MPGFQTIMSWVARLPEVGDPILKEREAILSLAREAAEFERLANGKRSEAHRAALALEDRIRNGKWTDSEINEAKAEPGPDWIFSLRA